jgi:hypothetical protein
MTTAPVVDLLVFFSLAGIEYRPSTINLFQCSQFSTQKLTDQAVGFGQDVNGGSSQACPPKLCFWATALA